MKGMCVAANVCRCDGETRIGVMWSSFGKHVRPKVTLQVYHSRRDRALHAYQPAAHCTFVTCDSVLAFLWAALLLRCFALSKVHR